MNNDWKGKSVLKRNVIFGSLSFVFISAISFLTIPLIVNKMGVEVFGIYTLITSLFGYFGIFDFGLGQGLIKFIAEYQATQQFKKLSLAINTCLLFQIIVGLVILIILYTLSNNIISILHVSVEFKDSSVEAFKLSLIGLFISLISAIFSSVLMGLQRYDLTSTVDSLINLLLNITLILLIFQGKLDLYGAVLVSVLFSGITLTTYVVLTFKKVPFFSFQLKFDVSIIKQFIKYTINIFLSKISGLFSNHLLRFILSYYLTPTAVTYFVVPSKLLNAFGGMLSNGANTLFPHISSLHANENAEDIKKTFLKASNIFAGVSIPVLLFISLFSKELLSFWMGILFAEKTWILLSIISISSLIGSLSAVPNLVILGMGNSKLIAFFSCISIFLYIIFIPFLTSNFGLIGCGVGLLLTTFITIFFVLYRTLKFIKVPPLIYLKFVYSKHAIPATIFISVTLLLNNFLVINNIYLLIFGLFLLSIYCAYIYNNVYLKYTKTNK